MPLEAREDPERPTGIDASYLLVTHIPVLVDDEGAYWIGRLWHADLMRHVDYLHRLTLAAPLRPRRDEPDLLPFDSLAAKGLTLVELPSMDSRREALLHLPRLAARLWRAMGAAEIVHSSMGGWPYPLALVASPLARLRRRRRIVVVESAPWRIPAGTRPPALWRRIYAAGVEAAARRVVAGASLALFTHAAYRESLLPGEGRHGHVLPASWLPDEAVLDDETARRTWEAKLGSPAGGTRILFAGRLTAEKGVEVLLEALRLLEAEGVPGRVDILGEGPLAERCARVAAELRGVRVTVHEPVPYGAPFFAFLRRYHAVVLPSLGDEQPRIIFDSYSQALPLLASATPGIGPHVREGETGLQFPPGDVPALAGALRRALGSPQSLYWMGMNALPTARSVTHSRMHVRRSRLIAALVDPVDLRGTGERDRG